MSVSITEFADCCQSVWQQSVGWLDGHSVSHRVGPFESVPACLPCLPVCLSHQRSSVLPCCAAWPLLLAHWNEEIWQQHNLPLLAGHPKVKKWVPTLELDQYKRYFATTADTCKQAVNVPSTDQVPNPSLLSSWLATSNKRCEHLRAHTHTHTW